MSEKLLLAPWNQEGLRFKCTGCGKCCTGEPGYVWLTSEDIQRLAAFFRLNEHEFKQRYTRLVNQRYALLEKAIPHDCVLLDGKLCTAYDARPKQCRTFPFWQKNLHSEKHWQAAALQCEGILQEAPPIPWDQIEKLYNEQYE